jgi:hypothetical protein
MDELINLTYEIIKDYRKGEEGEMSKEIIRNWINQFDSEDREFVLTELNYILKTRYFTKETFKAYLKTTFFRDVAGVMKDKFGIDDVKQIFLRSYIINQQPEGKSQKVIINLFEEVIQEELGLKLSDCGKEEPLCCIYLDDVLCTGDTIFKEISSWFDKKELDPEKVNLKVLEEKNIPLFQVFYSVHTLNVQKVYNRIQHKHKDHKVQMWHFWQDGHEIDNNYRDQLNSQLEFILPKEDQNDKFIIDCQKGIESKVDKYCEENKYAVPKAYFYRHNNSPKKESFYSSAENRDRFEKIILKKSIEVYNTSDKPIRMRPLGNGLTTDKSFGFGTLLFSWRNVPFNTPLVFWYEHRGWHPLFKRKWTTYKKEFSIDDIFG